MSFHNAQSIVAASSPAVVVERNAIKTAAEIVAEIVENKCTVPILQNFRIYGDGTRLSVVGTDLDMQIKVDLPAAADSRFDVTVSAHKLKELLKKAPASDYVSAIQNLEGETVSLDFEKVNYDLQSLPSDDFPRFKIDHAGVAGFELPGSWLAETLKTVMPAMSTEETRYYMNGIYIHCDDDGLHFVATDGHRLYIRTTDAPEGFAGMPAIIVPTKAVKTLEKLMRGRKAPESVLIAPREERCTFYFDNIELATKCVDGTFPDYHRVKPWNPQNTLSVDSAEFGDAISGVSLISSQRGRAVKLALVSESSEFEISANNPEEGKADATIECLYSGESMDIGYNYKYLQCLAKAACPEGGELIGKLADAGSPAIFTGQLEGFQAVLMPMRV